MSTLLHLLSTQVFHWFSRLRSAPAPGGSGFSAAFGSGLSPFFLLRISRILYCGLMVPAEVQCLALLGVGAVLRALGEQSTVALELIGLCRNGHWSAL